MIGRVDCERRLQPLTSSTHTHARARAHTHTHTHTWIHLHHCRDTHPDSPCVAGQLGEVGNDGDTLANIHCKSRHLQQVDEGGAGEDARNCTCELELMSSGSIHTRTHTLFVVYYNYS